MWRVIARLAASIWRAVSRSGPIAFSPYEPKLSAAPPLASPWIRSEEHTSELQSLMRISYAVFCLKKKHKNEQMHISTDTKNIIIQQKQQHKNIKTYNDN